MALAYNKIQKKIVKKIDFDSYLQLSLIFLHLVTSSREFRILAALNLELYHYE